VKYEHDSVPHFQVNTCDNFTKTKLTQVYTRVLRSRSEISIIFLQDYTKTRRDVIGNASLKC